MDSDDICTPPDILELATEKIEKKTTSFSENVILAYLKDLSDKFKPSSMWAKYSMLKSTLNIYNNIDIMNQEIVGVMRAQNCLKDIIQSYLHVTNPCQKQLGYKGMDTLHYTANVNIRVCIALILVELERSGDSIPPQRPRCGHEDTPSDT
ncbi:hypothetical protein ACJJTC_001908 [Scirpophaga incertulas]